ncbi:MAG: LPS export ABC transporter periplasmic protein LptC [Candidatus Marinimicrobia bacterium]|nr:LPS export ABC transporter periplasmic protein LptC [Candidatus Neomarinimicrobiota bacterium]MCF7851552.1 LPS export ABC transporter periplasmic protein LptC [Candidatus Neomarinimicrobiota bacterium]MCF7905273.1 LPS export ABC transporter periplasmic protein LptC [Candidatus Neomarinimicrobiota bacterium]
MAACNPVGEDTKEVDQEFGRVPNQESWNTTVRINSVGKETVQARAAYSAQYEDPQEVVFIGDVQLDFFDLEGNHSSTLSADTGRIDEKRHLFTANGNVYVESDSGMTLATSVLFWHENKELIYTDQRIVFTAASDTLYGIGFESDANLENWTIKEPTGVTYREFSDE